MRETARASRRLPESARRHIGRRIAAARIFRRLSTAQLEAAIDEKPGYVLQVEDGGGPLGAEELHRLTTHLRVGVRFFYDGAPPGVASMIARAISMGHEPGSLAEIAALLECLQEVG